MEASEDADSGGGLATTGVLEGFVTKGELIYLVISGKIYRFVDPSGIVPIPEIGSKVTVVGYFELPPGSEADYWALVNFA